MADVMKMDPYMPLKNIGVMLGLLFCIMSAAFDVYVAFITQVLDTQVVIFYCFISSTLLFSCCALLVDAKFLLDKLQQDWVLVVGVNVAVLLNWGGLFYALRYLEPAVVGVASVACGPAITLIVSVVMKNREEVTLVETTVACLVLLSVGVMLYQSFVGESGISSTSSEQRMVGIISVLGCALGTVMYTVVSKKLFARDWKIYEILAVRNLLMIVFCGLFVLLGDSSFRIASEWIIPMAVLILIGHLLPIYLIQKAIFYLSPLHVSFVLLTLPVFVLLLQYMDSRVNFSGPSVTAVGLIIALLAGLAVFNRRVERRGL